MRRRARKGPNALRWGGGFTRQPFPLGAKSLWFELAKKLAPDLQGLPRHQLLRETVEGLSLCILRATASQLELRCKIEDHCFDVVAEALPPPTY